MGRNGKSHNEEDGWHDWSAGKPIIAGGWLFVTVRGNPRPRPCVKVSTSHSPGHKAVAYQVLKTQARLQIKARQMGKTLGAAASLEVQMARFDATCIVRSFAASNDVVLSKGVLHAAALYIPPYCSTNHLERLA